MTRVESAQLDEFSRALGSLQGGQQALSERLDRTDRTVSERFDRIEELSKDERAAMNAKLDLITTQLAQATGGLAVGKALIVMFWAGVAAIGGAIWAGFTWFWPHK